VLRLEVTGALLTEILTAGQANAGSGGYLHLRGAASASGGWTVGNAPIDPARWYSIALPEFMLTGGEARLGFLTRANPGVRNVPGVQRHPASGDCGAEGDTRRRWLNLQVTGSKVTGNFGSTCNLPLTCDL
jgi:hypothetical protein